VRKVYLILSVLLGLVVLAATVLFALRPSMPSSWESLRPGMTQEEVEAVTLEGERSLGRPHTEMVCKQAPMLGAQSQWQLILEYDGPPSTPGRTVRLVHAWAGFRHPACAALNSRHRQLL
jgi:hypothetical protein